MTIFSQYGTGQRVGFVMICIAFAFCLAGSIAPYWIVAQTSIKDTPISDLTLFEVRAGIWYYCVDWQLGQKCYQLYDTSDYQGPDGHEEDKFDWINVVRACVVFSIVLSLISGLISCCRCLCCSGGKTVCHGVLSFIAGGFGLLAFGIFYNKTKDLLDIPLTDIDSGWALSIYTIGSILMVIASFILCCALPRDPTYGMVMMAPSAAPGGINVNVNNTNTNTNSTVNQYNAGGHIQSFEPLPYTIGPAPPQHPPQHPPMPQPMGYTNAPAYM